MDWVYENMSLVKSACKEVGKDLEGYRIGIAFPLEFKTAVLINELSNYCEVLPTPFSELTTKDEAVDWLRAKGIKIYETSEAVRADYYLDCVAKLLREANSKNYRVKGVIELTKSGVDFLRELEVEKAIVVDDSIVKGIGENVYGTGMGLIDGLMRLNINLMGKTAVVLGFGRVGRGCAFVLKKFCRVIVVEIDPLKALEAIYMGYEVLNLREALKHADILVTCAGTRKAIANNDFESLKRGCIICNMSAYVDEIDLSALKGWEIEDFGFIKKYYRGDKYFYLVADREAVNLALGNGTPIEIMDRTFATVVYALHYLIKEDFSGIIPLPKEIDEKMSRIIASS